MEGHWIEWPTGGRWEFLIENSDTPNAGAGLLMNGRIRGVLQEGILGGHLVGRGNLILLEFQQDRSYISQSMLHIHPCISNNRKLGIE